MKRYRSGIYGKIKGKEYRIARKQHGRIIVAIIDFPTESLPEGFCEYKLYDGDVVFRKEIQKEELEEVYYITTFAMYLGKKRGIAGGNEKFVHLGGTVDDMQYGFRNMGPREFIKENVPTEEVDEFIEEIEPYDIDLL